MTPLRSPPDAARAVLLVAALALLPGCAHRWAPAAEPLETVEAGWTQEGIASWYGHPFHGRQTASGEVYDMEAMTAAHRSLPFGTRVRVTVLATGRRTRVRINDRGPFVDDRVLDLSRAAARMLGILGEGTARVRLEVVDPPTACHEVQVGSYARSANAEEARRRLERAGEPTRLEPGPDGFTRVVAGPYGSRSAAAGVRTRHGGLVRACGAGRSEAAAG